MSAGPSPVNNPLRADGGVLRLAVSGAAGRMGQTVIETADGRDDLTVSFGIDVESDPEGTVPIYAPGRTASAITEHGADVFVDFTVPEATTDLASTCAEQNVALVVGTTGFEAEQRVVLEEASESVPVLKATNFSRGIQAFLRALVPALAALENYDVELSETHHNAKRDAPSGTANTLLEAIQEQRDLDPVYGRNGMHPRSPGEIDVLVSRLGDVRGEHEVRLGGNDEILSISHRAEDRAVFAAGALDAATWVAGQDPGWYAFGDVIDDA